MNHVVDWDAIIADSEYSEDGRNAALAILAESRRWVYSLDRTRLGSIAVDAELLALTHAVMLGYIGVIQEGTWNNELKGIRLSWLRILAKDETYKNDINDNGDAEVHLWWRLAGSNLHCTEDDVSCFSNQKADWLEAIYNDNAYLPFYEDGVKNLDLATRCISEKIDVNMAKELEKETV